MQVNENLVRSNCLQKGHVLLVSPLTFSYHIFISDTLESMGYSVTWWNERASSSIWYKIALRLFPSITVRWFERSFLERLHKLDPSSISHVLVIKGEGLSRKVVLKIREALPSASMGLYLWDGVENVKGVSNILSAFDSVSTFDPVDAKTFGWVYRPLFGRNILVEKNITETLQFDWCFIGTIHSDRHKVIHRLRLRYGQKMSSLVFCYFPSPLLLFMRLLVDWTLWLAPKGTLSITPMPANEFCQNIARSRAVVDVEHPRQRGYTMRTIETLLLEKKLVTTNKHILTSNLYHPSRVFVINRAAPEIPVEFLDQPYLAVPDALRNYYSCEGWVSELLELQSAAKNRPLSS